MDTNRINNIFYIQFSWAWIKQETLGHGSLSKLKSNSHICVWRHFKGVVGLEILRYLMMIIKNLC